MFKDKRGVEYQDFPSKTFCLTVPRNFVMKPFSVSLLSGAEEVWIREGEAVSRFSVENFLSHSGEKIRKGTLSCFTNFGYRKCLWKRGGGVTKSTVEKFCLKVQRNFGWVPFSVSQMSGAEKVWIRGGGDYKDFLSNFFFLTLPKIFVSEPFCAVSENFR